MAPSDGPIICPHCGEENRRSGIVTTCRRCLQPLEPGSAAQPPDNLPPAPELDLPPVPDLPTTAAASPASGWGDDAGNDAEGDEWETEAEDEIPLAPPPRAVPGLLRLHCIFGSVFSQMGWLFLGIGTVFLWVFGSMADLTPAQFAVWGKATAETVVGSVKRTAWQNNGRRVHAHHYAFRTPDGAEHEGVAYATGRSLDVGSPVTVEYAPRRPSVSRIKGMAGGAIPLWVGSFLFIFPTVGLGLLIGGTRQGLKGARLLSTGQRAYGVLAGKKPTGSRVNRRPVYKLTFEFADDSGQMREVVAKTHEPERLEDQRREPLLYDPLKPQVAVMLDGLPGRPRIDASGSFRAPAMGRAIGVLIVPALTVIGNLAWAAVCLLT